MIFFILVLRKYLFLTLVVGAIPGGLLGNLAGGAAGNALGGLIGQVEHSHRSGLELQWSSWPGSCRGHPRWPGRRSGGSCGWRRCWLRPRQWCCWSHRRWAALTASTEAYGKCGQEPWAAREASMGRAARAESGLEALEAREESMEKEASTAREESTASTANNCNLQ